MGSLDDRPQLFLRQESVKSDTFRQSQLDRRCLSQPAQRIRAHNVEMEIVVTVGEDTQRSEQCKLILHEVETRDVHESCRLIVTTTHRMSRRPALQINA
jgi:hypothetical protein